MRRMSSSILPPAALLVALLLASGSLSCIESAEARIVDPTVGSAPCTAASYAALPAGKADGTLCTDTSTGLVYRYDASASVSLWLPSWMKSSTIIFNYTADVVPGSDGWTKESAAVSSEAVAGGELTVTDSDNAGYMRYKRADAVNLVSTNNIAMIMRAQVTAQGALTTDGYKLYFGFRPSSLNMCLWSIAKVAALSAAGNVRSIYASSGANNQSYTQADPDNANYNTYLIYYDSANNSCRFAVLGSIEQDIENNLYFDTNVAFAASTASFGASTVGSTGTMKVDFVKVFKAVTP